MRSARLFLLTFTLLGSLAARAEITIKEAQEFCLKHWFPALVLGNGLDEGQKEAKLDQAMRFYTESAELVDPNNIDHFAKATLKGHTELKNYYRLVLSAYPEWAFEIKAIYPTADGFVLHYVGKNAPPVESFEGVDILKIERGAPGTGPESFRIQKLEGCYDRLPFTRKKPN